MKQTILMLLCLILSYQVIWCTLIREQPTTVMQPDGCVLNCLVSGDEYYHYLHDKEGYTIVQSEADGYFYYAKQRDNQIVPSEWIAGQCNPVTKSLSKHVLIPPSDYQRLRNQVSYNQRTRSRFYTPNIGTINNIVFFVRFAGDTEYGTHRSEFETVFNSIDTQSLLSYFTEVSYNQLTFNSQLYPICNPNTNLSYQDNHPRGYYLIYNQVTNPIGYPTIEQGWQRMVLLLQRVVNALDNEISENINIDVNNDGFVDNVCFIFRGGSGAWGDILWAQHGCFIGNEIQIHGKILRDFTLSPETQTSAGVHAHEMFHAVGAPDLYQYNQDGFTPVGPWDIMQGGNSSHMLAYMKYRYGGWIPAPIEINQPGLYSLLPLTSATNNCYRIPLPNSETEYLMVEYRNRTTGLFDTGLPGSGLIIYRINTLCDGQGNASGPPDEVLVYCPNGTNSTNGSINSAFFCMDSERTEFDDETNPADFLSTGALGGVSINQISSPGDSISFYLTPGYGVIQGYVLCEETQPDYERIRIVLGNHIIYPDSAGFYLYYGKQGIYNMNIDVPGYAVYNHDVTIEPEQMTNHTIVMEYLVAPQNLAYTAESGEITLSWSFSGFTNENFETFKIYRRINNFMYSLIGTTNQTSFNTSLFSPSLTFRYRVVAQYSNGISDSSNIVIIQPTPVLPDQVIPVTQLKSVYPNPSGSVVKINYANAKGETPQFSIYNIKGQKVAEILPDNSKEGEHTIIWNRIDNQGQVIKSGLYILKMQSPHKQYQKKLILY